jgi:uncharacterized protein YecE (DUF72 family)
LPRRRAVSQRPIYGVRPDPFRPGGRRRDPARRRNGIGFDRTPRLAAAEELRLGTQGWAYPDWDGEVYDAGTKPAAYLRSYAREFRTVEIDSTWYATPAPERVRKWAQTVPAGFTFACKLVREITHERRLIGCDALVAEFFTAMEAFGDALEAVLVQLGPDFSPAERDALFAFLERLPDWAPVAVEVRDPRWFAPAVYGELRAALAARGFALALSDAPFVPLDVMLAALAHPTADFAYLRWIGVHDAVARFDRVVFDRSAEIGRWAATSITTMLDMRRRRFAHSTQRSASGTSGRPGSSKNPCSSRRTRPSNR